MALALFLASAAAQQVYRWVDDDGVVHYSDQPPPVDARELESVDIDVPPGISNPSRIAGAAISNSQAASDLLRQIESGQNDQTSQVYGYRGLVIESPTEQQVIWNIATRLPVRVQVTPGLAGSHKIQMILDGQPIGEPSDRTSLSVSPVYRGEHSLVATVVDEEGNTLFTGQAVTFYVQQAGRAN
ncbi:MAG: DUF4124 domain-containing protein [Pseudomonadota bacterium]